MRTSLTLRFTMGAASIAAAFFLAPAAFAESGTMLPASLTIEQKSPIDAVGKWTLLRPGSDTISFRSRKYTIENITPGNFTLIVDSPQGMTTQLLLYDGTTLIKTLELPQLSFAVEAGKPMTMIIQYRLRKPGMVTVGSDPPGIPFTLKGPDRFEKKGTTPASFPDVPDGQYSVWFAPPGCPPPAAQSDILEKSGRINLYIRIECSTLDLQKLPERRSFIRAGKVTDTQIIRFDDVPETEWFAAPIAAVARMGILTGYMDGSGALTGMFGPGNNVTRAELAKIAHRVGGFDESEFAGEPLANTGALNTWYAPFIVSTEQRDWLIYTDKYFNLAAPATRGEVLVTLLQVLDIPLRWPTGRMFNDVTRRTPFAAAIETAAHDGVVSGTGGGSPPSFNPLGFINRAEMAKMVQKALEVYRPEESSKK